MHLAKWNIAGIIPKNKRVWHTRTHTHINKRQQEKQRQIPCTMMLGTTNHLLILFAKWSWSWVRHKWMHTHTAACIPWMTRGRCWSWWTGCIFSPDWWGRWFPRNRGPLPSGADCNKGSKKTVVIGSKKTVIGSKKTASKAARKLCPRHACMCVWCY